MFLSEVGRQYRLAMRQTPLLPTSVQKTSLSLRGSKLGMGIRSRRWIVAKPQARDRRAPGRGAGSSAIASETTASTDARAPAERRDRPSEPLTPVLPRRTRERALGARLSEQWSEDVATMPHTHDSGPTTLTERLTCDKSGPSPCRLPTRTGSPLARRRQAAAPALDPLDAAAPSETEGHVDDTKVVNPQPAEKPTDNPPQLRAIDAQRLSSRCNR